MVSSRHTANTVTEIVNCEGVRQYKKKKSKERYHGCCDVREIFLIVKVFNAL